MFKQLTLVAGLAITATLVGCASDAYYAAKSACEPLAYNKFPPKMVSQLVTKTRTVDVPIGMTNCSSKVSGSSINTTCRDIPVTQKKTETYQESEAVDINERPRKDMVYSCTYAKCRQQYGNYTCVK